VEVKLGCKNVTYENGETTSEVLAWNHFGTETIPPRPVLRIAAEKVLSSEEFKNIIETYKRDFALYAMNNRAELPAIERELLRKIGASSVAEAKRIIDSGSELQTNAPSTISSKGFNQPLSVNGTLKKTLGYEIEA